MSTMAHENNNEMLLSTDFVQKIESRLILNRNDVDYDPILQIADESTKFRKFTTNTQNQFKQQTIMHHLTIKNSSQLNDVSSNLKKGG